MPKKISQKKCQPGRAGKRALFRAPYFLAPGFTFSAAAFFGLRFSLVVLCSLAMMLLLVVEGRPGLAGDAT